MSVILIILSGEYVSTTTTYQVKRRNVQHYYLVKQHRLESFSQRENNEALPTSCKYLFPMQRTISEIQRQMLIPKNDQSHTHSS